MVQPSSVFIQIPLFLLSRFLMLIVGLQILDNHKLWKQRDTEKEIVTCNGHVDFWSPIKNVVLEFRSWGAWKMKQDLILFQIYDKYLWYLYHLTWPGRSLMILNIAVTAFSFCRSSVPGALGSGTSPNPSLPWNSAPVTGPPSRGAAAPG